MGKKSKLSKVGLTKKNYGNVMKIRKDKLKNLLNLSKKQTLLNQTNLPNSDSDLSQDAIDENLNSTKTKKNLNTTFANFDRTNLYNSIINLNNTTDKVNLTQLNQTFMAYAKDNNLNQSKLHHSLVDFATKPGDLPMRNRRVKSNTFLSKGQKKRIEKKEKVLKKKLLDEVLRKNKSIIINNKSQINKTSNNKTADLKNTTFNTEMQAENNSNKTPKVKKTEFDLMEMNNDLTNMLKDIKTQDDNIQLEKNNIDLKKRKKQNVKKLL